MDLMTGELAKRAGVNVETLRFDERKGLQTAPRRASGYRESPADSVPPHPVHQAGPGAGLYALGDPGGCSNTSDFAAVAAESRTPAYVVYRTAAPERPAGEWIEA
jgi:hypothetical protein